MANQQRTVLSDMPREVIDDIASELVNLDVASLHAVNRALFQKTKYAYAKRYLTHIHVFLHPVSFDKLDRLAKDPIYARYIDHITISTYVLRAREDRRKGTSVIPFEQGESFLIEAADQAIMGALLKTTGLKSLTIADYPYGNVPPAWGINQLNHLTTFKRGSAVVTEYSNQDDIKVWPKRMMALEACLVGRSLANLPARVELRMVLEGNAPRPLSPKAHFLFRRTLASATHITTNLDTYAETPENADWLEKINPKLLDVDYDTPAWTSVEVAPSLSLGAYNRLTSLRIVNSKTIGTELDNFLEAHAGTLRKVALQHVCLLWTDAGNYPWRPIFLTLAKISELNYLWLNTLSAFPVNHTDRKSDPCAAQEVAWKSKLHAHYALEILCDYYDRQGASGLWVEMSHVEEIMMEKYGITI
ncbi:hypothetical protein DPSP01_009520 [Paraphaeosphaeria sporulosa]